MGKDYIKEQLEKDKLYEELAIKEVVYGTHHILNTLIELLIQKGVISEQELRDKLEELFEDLEDVDDLQK